MSRKPAQAHERRARGFARAASLVQSQVREVGASRGFAVTRLLTHWPEIAGADIAAIARPVEVKYGRDGLGAVLTLLTTGANAPILEMQKEELRARVNACYGYAAISRIRITQTAPDGFSEGRVDFAHAPRNAAPTPADPALGARARQAADGVASVELREALATLGQNVLTRDKNRKGKA